MQGRHHVSKSRTWVLSPHGYMSLARCNAVFIDPGASYVYSHITLLLTAPSDSPSQAKSGGLL